MAKVTRLSGTIIIELLDESTRKSAVNQFVKDPSTEVYKGPEYARVSMYDIGIEVAFSVDPSESGNWKDAKWCRARAMDEVRKGLDEEMLGSIIALSIEGGKLFGRNELRADLSDLLKQEYM